MSAISMNGMTSTIQVRPGQVAPERQTLLSEPESDVSHLLTLDANGSLPLASWTLWRASASCLMLLVQVLRRADSRAAWTAGSSRPTSVPMIAITTSSSTSVNAPRCRGTYLPPSWLFMADPMAAVWRWWLVFMLASC